jgi:hypothetical protein
VVEQPALEGETAEDAAGEPQALSEDEKRAQAARALEWLDTTLEELRGALTACGQAIDTGALAPEVVHGRMNALVLEMMGAGG